MGNSNSGNEGNQSLLNVNNNQINDADISLFVNDQPQIKKIFAIKNPVYLKRNTLTLERDSNQRNLYYIQFTYDALVDMNINIYFNAARNLTKNKQPSDFNNKDFSSNTLIQNPDQYLNYAPSANFTNHVLRFNNCPKGQSVKFFDRAAFIDINNYISSKAEIEESYDVVIEFVPIFTDENSGTLAKNKNNINSTSDNEIFFYTLCKLSSEEVANVINPPYKIKTDLQRLKSQSLWFDIYEVFNSALESGECLICCNNIRNTLFLPCKHSCSCQNCAHSLRMRNNPCPICKMSIDDLVIVDTEEANSA